jgi:hypothetical protein
MMHGTHNIKVAQEVFGKFLHPNNAVSAINII